MPSIIDVKKTPAWGESRFPARLLGRAYSSSRADRRANISACTDVHEPTGAYGDSGAYGDFQARAYSDPNGNAGTDARAHGDEQPYARTNNDGNTYADTSPECSHVAGTRCSARVPVFGLRIGRLPLLTVG